MSRELSGYRETLEMLNELFPGRVALKTNEIATATGMCMNSVRQTFAEARIDKGIYNKVKLARLMCK